MALTGAGAFIRVGAATLGIAIVAASSTAVQGGTVPVRVQQAQTLAAASQLGSTAQIPPICSSPFAQRPITRYGLRSFRLILAQCEALRVPSAAMRTSAQPNWSTATWTESVPWTFTGNADGLLPQTTLLRDARGALIGENIGCNTSAACYDGIVFKLMPPAPGKTAWTETDLYAFPSTNFALGSFPLGGLVMDRRGALYGVTQGGGTGCDGYGCGVVVKLSPPSAGQTAWTETVLHTFTGGRRRSQCGPRHRRTRYLVRYDEYGRQHNTCTLRPSGALSSLRNGVRADAPARRQDELDGKRDPHVHRSEWRRIGPPVIRRGSRRLRQPVRNDQRRGKVRMVPCSS